MTARVAKKVAKISPIPRSPSPPPDWCDGLRAIVKIMHSIDPVQRRAVMAAAAEMCGLRLQ